jgi:hypothetical protein
LKGLIPKTVELDIILVRHSYDLSSDYMFSAETFSLFANARSLLLKIENRDYISMINNPYFE